MRRARLFVVFVCVSVLVLLFYVLCFNLFCFVESVLCQVFYLVLSSILLQLYNSATVGPRPGTKKTVNEDEVRKHATHDQTAVQPLSRIACVIKSYRIGTIVQSRLSCGL